MKNTFLFTILELRIELSLEKRNVDDFDNQIGSNAGIFPVSGYIWQIHFESKMFQLGSNNVNSHDIFGQSFLVNRNAGYHSIGYCDI